MNITRQVRYLLSGDTKLINSNGYFIGDVTKMNWSTEIIKTKSAILAAGPEKRLALSARIRERVWKSDYIICDEEENFEDAMEMDNILSLAAEVGGLTFDDSHINTFNDHSRPGIFLLSPV